MKRFVPSPALAIAGLALFMSVSGGAYAAGLLHIGTQNIDNGAVTASKIRDGAIGFNQLSPTLRRRLARIGVSGSGVPATRGERGPAGPQGPPGPQGAPGTPSVYESTTTCQPGLCMEEAPGRSGDGNKGGWWLNEQISNDAKPRIGAPTFTGQPVTSIAVGATASLNVVVEQPNLGAGLGESGGGEVTVTYDPYDFSYVGNSNANDTCNVVTPTLEPWFTGLVSCTTSAMNVDEFMDSFRFRALHANPDAQVTAAAILFGTGATLGTVDYSTYQETSGTFPAQITS